MILSGRQKKILWFALVVLAFVGIVFVYRGVAMQRTKLPLAVTYKIRNASAHENEWRIATTAQAGDVIEHFLLVHLPDNYPSALIKVSVATPLDAHSDYREATLESTSLGIAAGSGQSDLNIPLIAPGEFVDIKWQTRLKEEVGFSVNEAPLLESKIAVSAANFTPLTAKGIITLSSTVARDIEAPPASRLYLPRLISMNPRKVYDDLGGGILIAGEDLTGIKTLRISGLNRILISRLISNDLLEAGLPAGLKPGSYNLEALDAKGAVLADKLSFTILASNNRAVVIKVTPNVVKQGQKSAIVLQGVHLSAVSAITAQNGQSFDLENIKKINDRVLSADVPDGVKTGEYKLVIDDNKQEPTLIVD